MLISVIMVMVCSSRASLMCMVYVVESVHHSHGIKENAQRYLDIIEWMRNNGNLGPVKKTIKMI